MTNPTQGYKKTTRIVHGAAKTSRWDYSHHVVPPLTASTTFRLETVKRGARGFTEFGRFDRDESSAPVYIYDRLDEPTRGIDVGAKFEIYTIINELKREGLAVVMVSSELPEVLGMSDRIAVMREGRFVAEFRREEATQEKIMREALQGRAA